VHFQAIVSGTFKRKKPQMAQAIDDINWSALKHAYGEASDVPNDIKLLNSTNEEAQKDALHRLFGSIYHQGSRYTATVAAIPFLADAALEKNNTKASDVIYLLSAIAEPSASAMIKDKLTVAEFRDAIRQEDAELSVEERENLDAFGYYPLIEVEVYDAVSNQVERLWPLAEVNEPNLQCAMVGLLCNFPEYWYKTQLYLSTLLNPAQETEHQESIRVACIDAIRYASGFKGIGSQDDLLKNFISEDNTLMTRARAALACSHMSNDTWHILLTCLDEADKLFTMDRELAKSTEWTAAQISKRIAECGTRHPSEILPRLIGALRAASNANADTSVIVHAIVTLLAGGTAKTSNCFANKGTHDLSDNERKGLLAIADFANWKIAGGWSGNLTSMIKSYGLPDKPNQLRRYVTGPTGFFKKFF